MIVGWKSNFKNLFVFGELQAYFQIRHFIIDHSSILFTVVMFLGGNYNH